MFIIYISYYNLQKFVKQDGGLLIK